MIQFTTLKQIAAEMGVDASTLRRWMRKNNIFSPKGRIPPEQKETIVRTILDWKKSETQSSVRTNKEL